MIRARYSEVPDGLDNIESSIQSIEECRNHISNDSNENSNETVSIFSPRMPAYASINDSMDKRETERNQATEQHSGLNLKVIFAVIAIAAIIAVIISVKTNEEGISAQPVEIQGSNIENMDFQKSDLYEIALTNIPETMQECCYDDFDGDGNKEIFIITGNDTMYSTEDDVKSLWFISATGNVECIIDKKMYWCFLDEIFDLHDCKLLYVRARHGCYAVFGVKSDKVKEVGMPKDALYYWISQDPENGMIMAAINGKKQPMY